MISAPYFSDKIRESAAESVVKLFMGVLLIRVFFGMSFVARGSFILQHEVSPVRISRLFLNVMVNR